MQRCARHQFRKVNSQILTKEPEKRKSIRLQSRKNKRRRFQKNKRRQDQAVRNRSKKRSAINLKKRRSRKERRKVLLTEREAPLSIVDYMKNSKSQNVKGKIERIKRKRKGVKKSENQNPTKKRR